MLLRIEERRTDGLIDIRTCLLAGVAIIDRFGRWVEVDMRIRGEFFGPEFVVFVFFFFTGRKLGNTYKSEMSPISFNKFIIYINISFAIR